MLVRLFCTVLGLFSVTFVFSQVAEPTIATCEGTQRICLDASRYDLCVKITVNPGLPAPIDYFMIDWGDGEQTRVEGTENPADQNHEYDLTEFFGTCSNDIQYDVFLETFLTDGTPLNNAFRLTFVNPPIASFDYTQTVCVGTETCFDDTSCPEDGLEIVTWDYGDGTSNLDACHTYTSAQSFPVTLSVRNMCGEDNITQNINVIDPPVAAATPVSGIIANTSAPYLVCLGDNDPIILDAEASENAIFYDWEANTSSGVNWLSDRINSRDTLRFTQAGNYEITLTVNNACDQPDEVTLNFEVIDAATLELLEQDDACEMLSYTPAPFIEEATYTLNGEVVNNFPLTLAPGNYSVEATLSNRCGEQVAFDDFAVSELRTVEITTPDTTVCSGSAPIAITLSASDSIGACFANGVELLDCTFRPAEATESSYTITYEGVCLESNSVQIEVVQTGSLSIDLPGNTFCIEAEPFSITPNFEGGEWLGQGFADETSSTYNPALAGVGMDTITYQYDFDTGVGETCSGTATAIVEIFPALTVDFEQIECAGNTVTFDTLNTSVPFSTILYEFGDGASSNLVTPTHTYDTPGAYTVTVTLSQNGGCTAIQMEEITVEPPPTAGFTTNYDDPPCSELLVNIQDQSAGTNRSYFWNFGNGETSEEENPEAVRYQAVGRDTTYTLTLEVRNGCSSDIFSEEIFVKAGPNPYFELDKNLHCSGEEVAFQRIRANADSLSDFWNWNFGDGTTFDGNSPPPHIYEIEGQDTFMVSLTVGNECDTISFERETIVVPSDVTAFMNIDKTIGCSGEDFRFINASGVPGADFFLPDGNSFQQDTLLQSFSTPQDTSLSVMMRVYGCGYDDTTMTIQVRAMPELSLNVPLEACSDDSIEITTTSDVGGRIIYFGDGDSTLQSITEYRYDSAGVYTITAVAESSLGCTTSQMVDIHIKPSPAAAIQVNTEPLCAQNRITFEDVSTGTIDIWQWAFGDSNVSSGNRMVQHEYVESGEYLVSLQVVDENGCSSSIETIIAVRPLPEMIASTAIPDACESRVQFSTSTEATSFLWRFGDGNTSVLTNPLHTYAVVDAYTATLIAERNGCLDSLNLDVLLPEIPVLRVAYSQMDACAPSSVDFDASNSQNVEDWLWDFGDNTTSFDPTQTHTFVTPGNYEVRLEVTRGDCTLDTSLQILVGDTLLAEITAVQNVECFGESTGRILATVNSGNAPYSYTWSNGLNTNPATGLGAGIYQLTITDNLGCQLELERNVNQPSLPLTHSIVQITPVSCYEDTDGAVEIAASGGTAPYRYRWPNGSSRRELEGLSAGDYVVTITDASDCLREETITIEEPAPLVIQFDTAPICYGEVGDFMVLPIGGTPPYRISRSPDFEEVGDFYDDLPAGEYEVFVVDENDCTESAAVEITELPDWTLEFTPSSFFILKGDSVRLRPYLSITPADLEWQPSEGIRSPDKAESWAVPLDTVTYQLTAFDQFGCTQTDAVTIFVKDTVAVYIPNAFTPGGEHKFGDGVNDYFTAYSHFPAAKRIKSFIIAHKSGQILFEKTNVPLNEEEEGWDGRFEGETLPPDEYAYRIVVEYIDGEEQFKGKVRLIR